MRAIREESGGEADAEERGAAHTSTDQSSRRAGEFTTPREPEVFCNTNAKHQVSRADDFGH